MTLKLGVALEFGSQLGNHNLKKSQRSDFDIVCMANNGA